MLGDGYLRIVPNRSNALFEIHSSSKDYVEWKYYELKNIIASFPKQIKGKRISYRFSTRQHSDLTKIYFQFYKNRKKIVPDLKLDPLMIAVWFMDDGSKSYNTFYFNTQGFDILYQKKLIQMLKDQYRIESSLNKDKKYYRIRVKTNSAPILRNIINPYIISCMKYKLGETP